MRKPSATFDQDDLDSLGAPPPWWPESLYLGQRKFKIPKKWEWVNKPPVLNEILIGLNMHTMSYHLSDPKAAQQLRSLSLNIIKQNVDRLGAK